MTNKTLEISDELYGAIQQLKEVFWQMTWNTWLNDEEVLWILVWGFIQSLNKWNYQDVHNEDECCGWHWHSHWDDHECKKDWSCKNKSQNIIVD